MDAELKKIMDLVASGTITKEQGDILIKKTLKKVLITKGKKTKTRLLI